MSDGEYEIEQCACGECICAECDYEISVNMLLFDVIEERVRFDKSRGDPRLLSRVRALNGNLSHSDLESVSAVFDMLWPRSER